MTRKKIVRKQATPKKAARKHPATAQSKSAAGRRAAKAGHKQSATRKKKTAGKAKPSAAAAPAKAVAPPFPIVGVGASAGGLEAFTALLKALPADSGMAFVLVQHMDPTHESMLVPLLAKSTAMPVSQVMDGMPVAPNRVYVIPPNNWMSVHRGILRLVSRRSADDRHMPIDHFFESLAEDRRSGAIGVILSGTASDGTLGLKAIKAEGGITFAQSEKSAKYPGMPLSAINAGYVDFILPPGQIASELVRMRRHPYVAATEELPSGEPAPKAANARALEKIHRLLHSAAGVDFRLYKPGTITRRIHRRMALAKTERLDQYVRFIESHPEEVQTLFDDILIHVTGFFREPESFQALKTLVFPKIRASTAPGDPIRIWVPGCSSGEEVYSIAMALLEFLGDEAMAARIQIFGTDISERDITKARAGVYPEASLADVSSSRLRRFFVKVEDGYQVVKLIRELCVFARHDLTKNPPFSKLDLISCRNLLIYFGPALQKKVMALFHYALKPSGYLLLGKSEAISGYSQFFSACDRKSNIYSRMSTPVARVFKAAPADFEAAATEAAKQVAGAVPFDLQKEGERIILERYAPPGFFIDPGFNIVHFQGDTSPFLRPATGQASFQLLRMVRPELQLPLKTALHKAKKLGEPVRSKALEITRNGRGRQYEIQVIPVRGGPRESADFLVLFRTPRPIVPAEMRPMKVSPAKKRAKDAKELESMRREVASTREYLLTVTEQQEAGAEELRAANEEILSSNEELQSTNEELETAKEELQSSNEELSTLNEELQNRNRELDELANELSNLLTGTEIPIVTLGEDLRIRRFTSPAESLLNLLPSDVGRPIQHIRPRVELPNLEELAAGVIAAGRDVEHEVADLNGRWYSLRVKPHRTGENRIDGVLLALVDVTRLKESEAAALREREATISALLESAARAIIAADKQGRLKMVNSLVEQMFGYGRDELLGQPVEMLLPERFRKDHRDHLRRFFAQPQSRPMGLGAELLGRRKDGTEFPIEVGLSPIESSSGALVIAYISDISRQRRSEKALRETEARLQAILDNTPALVYLKDIRGRYLLINRGMEQVFNVRNADVTGKTPHVLFPRREARRLQQLSKEVLESGVPQTFERTMKHRYEVRTLLCGEFPLLGPTGDAFATCGICTDITERKRMEEEAQRSREALRGLTNRLISTQEQQYSKLARELHDDFNQALAALGMEIGGIQGLARTGSGELPARLGRVQERIAKLAESLHDLSRRLHPAVLDDLGLVVALENECRAFSIRYGVPARFRSRNLPVHLPDETGLCLYRVAQESLLNVGKHSGSKQVEVSLTGTKREVILRVVDTGDGFDLEKVRGKGGLGLVSMDERVRFSGGRVKIESQPGAGTTVEARLPLSEAAPRKQKKKVSK